MYNHNQIFHTATTSERILFLLFFFLKEQTVLRHFSPLRKNKHISSVVLCTELEALKAYFQNRKQ